MTPAFRHYHSLRSITSKDRVYLKTISDTPNTYEGGEGRMIPAGTLIMVWYGYNGGLYGRYESSGLETVPCEISANDFHRLEIVSFNAARAENFGETE